MVRNHPVKKIILEPIGYVASRFRKMEDVPRQSDVPSAPGEIRILRKYADGLKDIEGFSHLMVIFAFHKSQGYSLRAMPPFDNEAHGVFATKSPQRPNPIGVTVVQLLEKKGNTLKVKGIDMLDRTPVLDIKPFTTQVKKLKIGWLSSSGVNSSEGGKKWKRTMK